MSRIFLFVFISVCLTGEICSGFLKFNVCKYKKEETSSVHARSCRGMKERLCRRFFGFLSKPEPSDFYEDCCAGYTDKGPFGCLKKTCIVLPQDANLVMCKIKRDLKLRNQRSFYKLTTPPEEPLDYPNKTQNLFEAVSFPLLDQPSVNVILRSSLDPTLHEQRWVIRYIGMAKRNEKMAEEFIENLADFTKYSDYDTLLKTFRDEQSKPLISVQIPGTDKDLGIVPMEKYMRYPSQELPFKDIIKNEAWQTDNVFAQQRLAGLNPMALRKMTIEDFNQDFVNTTYDWDAAMQRASGGETTVAEMIDAGKVFIIDYKFLYNVSNVEDYTERNTTDRREIRVSRSPFCLFVTVNVDGVNELKAVAIQTDLNSDAPVFSPIDGAKWLLAKQEIQLADFTYVGLIEHLLKTHLILEPICVIMRRTLSSYHPLHQHLQWICRGLFVTNSLGIKALLLPEEFLHKLFSIGHTGAVEFINKAYPFVTWADTEFDKNLERRGVNNREELPYFPYRDDGLLFWKEVGDFAKEYVNLYYLNDELVVGDTELQDFADQLSADGTGTNGGIGMYKGFPAKIETKSQLVDVLKRISFIPVQHSAVNYPIVYYGAYVPNMPMKLYDDPRVPPQEFGFHTLPQAHVATEQVALTMNLGSLRYDVIFDYGPEMKDDRAKAVVNKYHKRLTEGVNDEITARNNQRLADGKMSYPYFLPKWVTNSIHT